MNPVSEDIKTILISDGVGSAIPADDWGIHIGVMPETPDRVIYLSDSGGMDPIPLMDTSVIHHPSCHVLVRGLDYLNSYSKCEEIVDSVILFGGNSSMGGAMYWNIIQQGDIGFLTQDDSARKRFIWTLNFRAQRH